GIGVEDLPFDDAAYGASALSFGEPDAKGFVEVGTHDPFGARAREYVTGPALGHELPLAGDFVDVVGALQRAAGGTERERRQGQGRERAPRPGARRAAPSGPPGGRPLGGRAAMRAGIGCGIAGHEPAEHYPKVRAP